MSKETRPRTRLPRARSHDGLIQTRLLMALAAAILLTASLTHLVARELRITGFHRQNNEFVLTFSADTNAYHILRMGTNVVEMKSPVALRFGEGQLEESFGWNAPQNDPVNFLQIEEVPIDQPLDSDGDGLDDLYEIKNGFDPLNPDTDLDGIRDDWEVEHRLDPLNSDDALHDFDKDGFVNIYEYVHGRDPRDVESHPLPGKFIAPDAEEGGDGSNEQPFRTIQDAIDAADPYDVVVLRDGVYTGEGNRNISFRGKPIMLISESGRDNCVIDCQGVGRAFRFHEGETRATLLRGVTVRGGVDSGIECENSSPTILDCVITHNSDQKLSGGLILANSQAWVENCRFDNNEAALVGGAVACVKGARPTLFKCQITNNRAGEFGGGIYCTDGSYVELFDTLILGNYAPDSGGGMFIVGQSTGTLHGCVIGNNHGEVEGGGILVADGSGLMLLNTIFHFNRAAAGSALFAHGDTSLLLNHCTIAFNHLPWDSAPLHVEGRDVRIRNSILSGGCAGSGASDMDVRYSCVEGGYPGAGNVNADPQMVPQSGRLRHDSPCIGAACTSSALPKDFEGESRDLWPDIGADEFVDSDGDTMPDTWEKKAFGTPSRDGSGDFDEDGLCDRLEYYHGTLPHIPDTDGDGLLDGEEVLEYGTDPHSKDTDKDDMPDAWEIEHGLDPLNPHDGGEDPDGDMYPHAYEYAHGTNPRDRDSAPSPTIFVDPLAAPDGDGSPEHPFATIQDAIDAAQQYSIIGLADGTYSGDGNREIGYREMKIEIRSLNGPDNCIIDCEAEYAAFTFHSEGRLAMLSGVTVRNADWAAIMCTPPGADPMIRDCIIEDSGEAIHLNNASPRIERCIIRRNDSHMGSAINCWHGSMPHILDCIIEMNKTDSGGAIACDAGSSLILERSIVRDNGTRNWHGGAGLYMCGSGTASISRCVFTGNFTPASGGAVFVGGESTVEMRNSIVMHNHAGQGGGVFVAPEGKLRISNSTFLRNSTYEQGTDIFAQTDKVRLINTILAEGMDGTNGPLEAIDSSMIRGGTYANVPEDMDFRFVNGSWRLRSTSPCIDSGTEEGAPEFDFDGEARFTASWVSNRTSRIDIGADEFVDTDFDGMADIWELEHFGSLDRQGDEDDDNDGLSNLDEYQLGCQPNIADTDEDGVSDGDELGNGTDPLNPDSDGDGIHDGWEGANGLDPLNPDDSMLDADGDGFIAYYEYTRGTNPTDPSDRPAPNVFVDPAAGSDGNGTQEQPFNIIQKALNKAPMGSIVQLADGIYKGEDNRNISFGGNAHMLVSANGPDNCIIDCEGVGTGFIFAEGETRRTIVRGVSIRNAAQGGMLMDRSCPTIDNCHIIENNNDHNGGGISCINDAGPMIIDCVIADNFSKSGGGGVFSRQSRPFITRCRILNNTAQLNGGGIESYELDRIHLEHCVIRGNLSQWSDGGGLSLTQTTNAIIKNCLIDWNTSRQNGGGVMIHSDSVAVLRNCRILNNHGNHGGALYINGMVADVKLINCTINSSDADAYGTAAFIQENPNLTFLNTILWGPGQALSGTYGFEVRYSCIKGGYPGEGNFDQDPLLIPGTGRLRHDSPCIDAGTSDGAPAFDMDGEGRFEALHLTNRVSAVDVGADEWVDSDEDLLADAWELIHFGALDHDASEDADGDGLTNLEEYHVGIDPTLEDSDGDGLSDPWEIERGLNPANPYDSGEDADSDGLSNLDEYLVGTDMLNRDTDGDGIVDGAEHFELNSDPTVADLTLTPIALLSGADSTNRIGPWREVGSDLYCDGARGVFSFNVEVPQAGIYVLELSGGAHSWVSTLQHFELLVSVDGEHLQRLVVPFKPGEFRSANCFTPWLAAGSHRIDVLLDNSRKSNLFIMHELSVLALSGGDSLGEWWTRRLEAQSRVEVCPAVSHVSPVCIEGIDPYLSMMSISDGIAVQKGTDNNWFANIPLSPTGAVDVVVSFQGGGRTETHSIEWKPANLLASGPIILRKGDSILLTAFTGTNPCGTTTIAIQEEDPVTIAASDSLLKTFDESGLYEIEVLHITEQNEEYTNLVQVTVMDAAFHVSPLVMVRQVRSWTDFSLDPGVVIDAGQNWTLWHEHLVDLHLTVDEPVDKGIVARAGDNGPIIAATVMRGFRLDSGNDTYTEVVEQQDNGDQIYEMGLVLYPAHPEVTIHSEISAGGLVFEDGTIFTIVESSDFLDTGEYPMRFVLSGGGFTSICHRMAIFQADELLGWW